VKNRKPKPWRIIIFILSLAFIVFMWSKKDIAAIYATMPPEEIMPLIATTLAVSALKVAAIAVAVFFVKWIIDKAKK
jgi:hypothetical protein